MVSGFSVLNIDIKSIEINISSVSLAWQVNLNYTNCFYRIKSLSEAVTETLDEALPSEYKSAALRQTK